MAEDQAQRAKQKAVYKRVLRIVEHNTHRGAGGCAGMVSERAIQTVASHANLDSSAVQKALRAAVKENDDLVTYVDDDGVRRYGRRTKDGLLKIIEWQSQQDEPNQAVIGECNEMRRELQPEGE